FFNFPTRHPMHLGFNASAFVKQADLILLIDSSPEVLQDLAQLSHRPKIFTVAVDPPAADIDLMGNPALTIRALTSLLDKSRRVPDSWFEGSLTAALGARLASPDLTVVATLDDRAYVQAQLSGAAAPSPPGLATNGGEGAAALLRTTPLREAPLLTIVCNEST